MKKIIRLTEGDLIKLVKRVMSEKIGDKPTTDMLNSQKGKQTINFKKFLNQYYNLNLPLDGDWMTKEYNDATLRYFKEKGITPWICKPNDGWCGPNDEGEVTTKDFEKLDRVMKDDIKKMGSKEKINTTNDSYYDYMFKDGKYYFKGKNATKYPNWIEATGKGLESIKNNVKFQ